MKLKRILSTGLVAVLVVAQLSGCGLIDNIKIANKLLQEAYSQDDSKDKADADSSNQDQDGSSYGDQEQDDEDEDKTTPAAVSPAYSTDKFQIDSSFANVTEKTVNTDLLTWLSATYAIMTDSNMLQFEYIGGKSRGSVNMDTVFKLLEQDYEIVDRDSLMIVVNQLIAHEENSSDLDSDAFYLMWIEEVLAQGYATEMIEMGEYLSYAVPVARMIQGRYTSWDDYGDNFLAYNLKYLSEGGYGTSEEFNVKANSHQYLVSGAQYYFGPYQIEFDLNLTNDANAKYFYNVDKNVVVPEAEDRIPIGVQAYIEPRSLGTKTTSGILELDGDLYHMPATVSSFTDNGWVQTSDNSITSVDNSLGETVYFERNGKKIALECDRVFEGSSLLENCFVTDINTYNNDEDAILTLPGGIKCGLTREEVDAILDEYNDAGYEEVERLNTLIEYYISLEDPEETRGSSRIILNFDGMDSSSVLNSIHVTADTTAANRGESKFTSHVHDELQDNIQQVIKSGESAQAKKNGDKVNLPTDLESKTFQIGMKTFSVPTTAQELIDGGWRIDKADLDKRVAAGDREMIYIFYGDDYDHMGMFGYLNNSSEDVNIKDVGFNYCIMTETTSGDDNLPITIGDGIQIGVSTLSDFKEIYGEPSYSKEIENGDVMMISSSYEFTGGKVIIVSYKETDIISDFHIYDIDE